MRRLGSVAAWCATGVLVVLVARWIAYALSPVGQLPQDPEGAVGGPALVVVALVSLGLAAALATAAVGAAALAVRERAALESEAAPRLDLRRVLLHAGVLWLATSFGFALLESHIHERAGLGRHGLHCLLGPAHRNAVPLLAALSLLAAALAAAERHLRAWARRVLHRLLARPRVARVRLRYSTRSDDRPSLPLLDGRPGARAPPLSLLPSFAA